MSKIDAQTETKIVALIARGDSYQSIKEQLEQENITVSISLIGKVKERNAEALTYISKELVKHETTNARRIMGKARDLVEKQLDEAAGNEELRSDALRAFLSGDITKDELDTVLHNTGRQIALKDLITASKEFFNQSQIEAGKPTSITESPEQAKKNLKTLLEAIDKGDEAAMVKGIFIDAQS